jgi:hypothetical protein
MNEARTAQLWGKRIRRGKDRLKTSHRGSIIGCTGLIHDTPLTAQLSWANPVMYGLHS